MIKNKQQFGGVTIAHVNPADLKLRRENFRAMSSQERLALKSSIRKYGFRSFVLTRAVGEDDLEIIDGHHRTSLAIELGLTDIPVVVLEEGQDPTSVDLAMLAFNVHASPVTDQMFAFLKDVAEHGASAEDIASLTALDTKFVDALLFSAMDEPMPAAPPPLAVDKVVQDSPASLTPELPQASAKSVVDFFKRRYNTTSEKAALSAAAAELYDQLILD